MSCEYHTTKDGETVGWHSNLEGVIHYIKHEKPFWSEDAEWKVTYKGINLYPYFAADDVELTPEDAANMVWDRLTDDIEAL